MHCEHFRNRSSVSARALAGSTAINYFKSFRVVVTTNFAVFNSAQTQNLVGYFAQLRAALFHNDDCLQTVVMIQTRGASAPQNKSARQLKLIVPPSRVSRRRHHALCHSGFSCHKDSARNQSVENGERSGRMICRKNKVHSQCHSRVRPAKCSGTAGNFLRFMLQMEKVMIFAGASRSSAADRPWERLASAVVGREQDHAVAEVGAAAL